MAQLFFAAQNRIIFHKVENDKYKMHFKYTVSASFHKSMISKTADSTTFNFGRPLGLSMRGKKLVELMT